MCTGGNKIEKKNICFVKWFYLSVSIEFLLNPLRVTSLKKKKEVLQGREWTLAISYSHQG